MKIRILGCGGSFGSPLAWNRNGNIDITNKKINYQLENNGYQFYGCIEEKECSKLLTNFFKKLR